MEPSGSSSAARGLRGALLLGLLLALPSAPGAEERLFTPRIVNGVDTQGQPTTGALLQPSGSGFVAGCSGTLIGCQTFLTAGHCVCPGDDISNCTPSPADYAVYLQHAGILSVSSVDVHPDYHFNVESDVAVLTLSEPTTGIPPTAINTIGTPALGATGTIAGYGITSGAQDDAGILREGQITTASCSGVAPEPAHVCWVFEAPIGPAGEDSNTCSGDSGGPLFMDLGAGEAVLAGVTSGGTSSLCLGSDVSFDANVFENRAFIQSIAGGDLGSAACGTLSQVGDPETQVTTLAAAGPPDSNERKCRGEVVNQVKRYTSRRHALLRACYDRVQKDALEGPCPDPVTTSKLQQAADKVDPSKLARKCSSTALAGSRLGGACASAQNESELADCIVSSVDGGVTAMLDVQYADSPPGGAIADATEAKCQRRIAKQLRTYAMGKISALKSCRSRLDRGVVAACPDAKAADRIAILAGRVAPKIARDCGDAQVAALDAAGVFGGSCAGASTAAGLAACELADHDQQVDALMGLVQEISSDNRTTFEVAPGSERFRVTLNAVDPFDGSNDLDVFLKLGAPPSPTDFDLSSTNAGVFEAIESVSPAAGTWHVLVETFAGVNVGFQLTATTFEP